MEHLCHPFCVVDCIYYHSIGLDYIEGLPFDGSLLANNCLLYFIVLKSRLVACSS